MATSTKPNSPSCGAPNTRISTNIVPRIALKRVSRLARAISTSDRLVRSSARLTLPALLALGDLGERETARSGRPTGRELRAPRLSCVDPASATRRTVVGRRGRHLRQSRRSRQLRLGPPWPRVSTIRTAKPGARAPVAGARRVLTASPRPPWDHSASSAFALTDRRARVRIRQTIERDPLHRDQAIIAHQRRRVRPDLLRDGTIERQRAHRVRSRDHRHRRCTTATGGGCSPYSIVHFGFVHIGVQHARALAWSARSFEPATGPARFATIYVVSVLGGAAGAHRSRHHTGSPVARAAASSAWRRRRRS